MMERATQIAWKPRQDTYVGRIAPHVDARHGGPCSKALPDGALHLRKEHLSEALEAEQCEGASTDELVD